MICSLKVWYYSPVKSFGLSTLFWGKLGSLATLFYGKWWVQIFLCLLNLILVIIFAWRIMHFTQVYLWLFSPYLILCIGSFSCPPQTKFTNGLSISYPSPRNKLGFINLFYHSLILIFIIFCFYFYYFLPSAFHRFVFCS